MSVITRGQQIKGETMGAFSNLANMEQRRNETNNQIRAGRKAQMVGNAVSGAMMGASFGPVGAAVGGGIGLLTSFL